MKNKSNIYMNIIIIVKGINKFMDENNLKKSGICFRGKGSQKGKFIVKINGYWIHLQPKNFKWGNYLLFID